MKKLTLLALACATSVLAACGGGGTDSASGGTAANLDAETQALVTEAKNAGPVTFYSMLDESTLRALSEDFSKNYGVRVEPVRLVTADLIQRYSAEASSGESAADIMLLTDSGFFADALAKDWITPIAKQDLPPAADTFPKDYLTHDGSAAVVSLIPSEMVINSDDTSDTPSDWKAYADTQFKGKLMLTKPDSSPANIAFWSLMKQQYGDDFLEQIAANQPQFMNSAVPLTQGIAAGEAQVGFPGVAAIVNNLTKQGAPVQLVSLAPTTGPEAALALSKNSSNPAGAKLLASYLMSEAGNKLLNDDSDGISPYDPEGTKRFTRVENIKLADAAQINALLGVN
ncbi:ABC transporter substrate-binding protein [Rhodococcus sp. LB1]|uniref:ABC transporter substrate-binding protein n=1 Tax=Rhodococcus sp. LB1 TaxID=1807499 RepID=UPI000779FCFB|nr:extracellular solute-binding protein [Rhodococcus sp. LB1]KXX59174.1 hypothetical protein AZG88_42370 [Rhodococcus sp. LB1]